MSTATTLAFRLTFIYNYIFKGGLMSKMYDAMLKTMAIRNRDIYLIRKKKESSDAEIGRRFGITRQRVKTIYLGQLLKELKENGEDDKGAI
tara:strand:+ start:1670 stop:1942 length:273 start_codon:yes stop_codon:yes gene_type:complete